MNIYQLVAARKSLNNSQQFAVFKLLTFRARREQREQVRQVLNNKFYSTLDGKEFGKQFELSETGCDFKPVLEKNKDKELRAIREYILSQVNL